jgi:anaphase-promoting complex subunit 7
MSRAGTLASARLTSWLRAGEGARAEGIGPRPLEPLVLFEFEACPFCRRVREALTRLDLVALIRPCPKGGRRHREALRALGGKEQFPFLVDPNAGVSMYESSDIVAHLEREYGLPGGRQSKASLSRSSLALMFSGLGRGIAGSRVRASREPALPLLFYGFEALAEARLVREVLCELELAYESRPTAPGSVRAIDARTGEPAAEARLVDPNTDAEHTGWEPIVAYLEATYALPPSRE